MCKNYIVSYIKFVTHNDRYFFVLPQLLELVTVHRRLHENGHLFGIDVRRVSRISGVKLAFCFWVTRDRYLSHLGNILSNFEYNSFLSIPTLSRFQGSFNTLTFTLCLLYTLFFINFLFQMETPLITLIIIYYNKEHTIQIYFYLNKFTQSYFRFDIKLLFDLI